MKPVSKVVTLPQYMEEIFHEMAVMELDRLGRPKTEENIRVFIEQFANDAMPSLRPNPRRGFGVRMNPTPTLSQDIFLESMRFMRPVFERYASSGEQRVKLEKEFKRLVMSLVSLYMGMVLDMPRPRGARGASPFEFVSKTGGEESEAHNKRAEILRYYRILIEASIVSSLEPVFSMSPEEVHGFMIDAMKMGNVSSKKLRAKSTRKAFVRGVMGVLREKFSAISIVKTLIKA